MGLPANVGPTLNKLIAARATAAELVSIDPVYLPIFERMDAEVEKAEAARVRDPVLLARLLSEQRKLRA